MLEVKVTVEELSKKRSDDLLVDNVSVNPFVRLALGIIKQAVDDYYFGKTCKIKHPDQMRMVQNHAKDAQSFFVRNPHGLDALWSRLAGTIDTGYLKRLIDSPAKRVYNFEKREGKNYARYE